MEELAHSQDLSPDDIIIPVMGITGSGKSTFISRCIGNDAAVGHGLKSCTKEVSYATIRYKDRTIRLVDTPGFDDSDEDESKIFKEISYWLLMAYSQKPPLLLSGIVYFHPITNVRMKGTDKSNLAMFQALCGKESLSCVVIATTMWGKIETGIGDKRHANWSEKYWKDLVDAGTTVIKHADTTSSALSIIDHIIQQDTRVTLKVQHELSSGTQLLDTDAGREVSRKLNEERETAEKRLAETKVELDDAQKRSDDEDKKEILEMQARYRKDIQAKELELEQMKMDMETLFKQKEEDLQKDKEAAEVQRKSDEDKLSKLTQHINSIKASQQEQAAAPAKYESMDFTNVDELIQAQTQEHQLQMQLESEKHKQEIEETKRHSEMLKATKEGVSWGKKGAVVGAGGLAVGAGSLIVTASDACSLM